MLNNKRIIIYFILTSTLFFGLLLGEDSSGGAEMDFISRFSARFSYQDFDPEAPSKIVLFFPDGKLISLDVDFSKIR